MPRFPSTHWSLVDAAAQADPVERRANLDRLLTRYLPALKAHLRYQKGLNEDQAEDLLQGFVTRKILEQEVLTQVLRGKGKFRTWLLTVLDRYFLSEYRYQSAAKRSAAGTTSLDAAGLIPADGMPTPAVAFDQQWAREVLAQALERMEAECSTSQRPDLWGVFTCRILRPALEGTEPTPYDQLIEQFGYASPVQASNALITAKRMFTRQLRAVLGEYCRSETEVDEEILELQKILAGRGAG